jgi:hypothetical protein
MTQTETVMQAVNQTVLELRLEAEVDESVFNPTDMRLKVAIMLGLPLHAISLDYRGARRRLDHIPTTRSRRLDVMDIVLTIIDEPDLDLSSAEIIWKGKSVSALSTELGAGVTVTATSIPVVATKLTIRNTTVSTVVQIECPPGHWGASGECIKCAQGTYRPIGADEAVKCLACSPGTYQPFLGRTECTVCGAGNYSANPLSCEPCQKGQFCVAGTPGGDSCVLALAHSTTDRRGARSKEDCVCKEGYFMDEDNSCEPCPAMGTNCTSVGVTVATLPLFADWWRLPNSTQLERCFSISNCTGGSDAHRLCGVGYEGAFCGVCSEDINGTGYHRSMGRCKPCEGSVMPAIIGMAVGLALLLLLLLALYKTSKGRKLQQRVRERAKKYKEDNSYSAEVRESDESQPRLSSGKELSNVVGSISLFDSLMVKLRVLISMIQVLSQLGVVYSIPFPDVYSSLLRWMGLLELNLIDLLPLGCVMTAGFYFSLLVRTLVLPILLLIGAAAKLFRAPAKVIELFKGLNFFVLFLIYPSTSAAVFATFQCEELSDGTRWLRADLSVDCDSDIHKLASSYASLMILVYPLGTPLFYLFLLWRNRVRLHKLIVNQALRVQLINHSRASSDYQSGRTSEDKRKVPWLISEEERSRLPANALKELRDLEHEDVTERAALPSQISKLLKGYELRMCWFEVFECVRKLAVACLPVFFQPSGSASQLLFGLMVCFVCFGAYVHFDPFEDKGNDTVARLCQVQIFFSLLSSVALSFSDDESAGSSIDMLLVLLWFLPVTLAVFLEMPLKSVVSQLLPTKQKKSRPSGPVSAEAGSETHELDRSETHMLGDEHNAPSEGEGNSDPATASDSKSGPSIARPDGFNQTKI